MRSSGENGILIPTSPQPTHHLCSQETQAAPCGANRSPFPLTSKCLTPGVSWLPPSLLNEATGSLLDDVQLVNTLQTSKITATEVTEQLETSETTEINIDLAREVSFCPLRSG